MCAVREKLNVDGLLLYCTVSLLTIQHCTARTAAQPMYGLPVPMYGLHALNCHHPKPKQASSQPGCVPLERHT